MEDILRRIRNREKGETSPVDKLLGREPPSEEEEEETEITHYGRTIAGSETSEEALGGGFREVDLEAEPEAEPKAELEEEPEEEPEEEELLEASGYREIAADKLDEDFEAPPPESSPLDDAEVVTLKTGDERKIRYIRLIARLLEEDFFDQALDAVKELRSPSP